MNDFFYMSHAVAYQVDVDDETTDITITVECEPFEVVEMTDLFYNIVRCAKQIRFSSADEFYVRVSFSFGGIWKVFQ